MAWARSSQASRVRLVSNVEHILVLPQNVFHLTIVSHAGSHEAYRGVPVLFVILPKKTDRNHDCPGCPAKRSGSSGRYFMVRNWLFEKGIVAREIRPTVCFPVTHIDE